MSKIKDNYNLAKHDDGRLGKSKAGLNPIQRANARAAIDTGKIIGKLQRVIEGKEEITNMQFKSMELLLRKSLPDLTAVTIDAVTSEHKTITTINITGVSPKLIEG